MYLFYGTSRPTPNWKYCKSYEIMNLISYQIHLDMFQVLKLAHTSESFLVLRVWVLPYSGTGMLLKM